MRHIVAQPVHVHVLSADDCMRCTKSVKGATCVKSPKNITLVGKTRVYCMNRLFFLFTSTRLSQSRDVHCRLIDILKLETFYNVPMTELESKSLTLTCI